MTRGRRQQLLPPMVQLVDLDQIAAIVWKSKRTLRRYLSEMPRPARRGTRGSPALWVWHEVRPWLVKRFGMDKLPLTYHSLFPPGHPSRNGYVHGSGLEEE